MPEHRSRLDVLPLKKVKLKRPCKASILFTRLAKWEDQKTLPKPSTSYSGTTVLGLQEQFGISMEALWQAGAKASWMNFQPHFCRIPSSDFFGRSDCSNSSLPPKKHHRKKICLLAKKNCSETWQNENPSYICNINNRNIKCFDIDKLSFLVGNNV
jgi:hypothetical protein